MYVFMHDCIYVSEQIPNYKRTKPPPPPPPVPGRPSERKHTSNLHFSAAAVPPNPITQSIAKRFGRREISGSNPMGRNEGGRRKEAEQSPSFFLEE